MFISRLVLTCLNTAHDKRLYFPFNLLVILLIIGSCSEAVEEPEEEEEELVEVQLPSCVDYNSVSQDDLTTYWNLFVEDVKCTRGGPDFGVSNEQVLLQFVVQTPEQLASGVTPDHAGFSTFIGYCNNSVVDISVIRDYWEDYTEIQQLWLMYHEFGHDVYRYEHSSDPDDIMWPSVPRSDVKINDFIEAKNRFFRRDFDGVSYIQCPNLD